MSVAKGPRLWLKPAQGQRKAAWIVKDGAKRVSTGCGAHELEQAQKFFADYLAEKYRPRDRKGDPAQIPVADAINLYATDVGPSVGRPNELARRLMSVALFFAGKTLADVNGASCRAYAAQRPEAAGRRELEDFRAAINYHRKEGLCTSVVEVTLPPKPPARERWLTRSEAARMIWAAWRYREVQKGIPTERRSRQHVARFILVGLYTGTRSAAICGASLTRAIGRGHVDLDAGIFYRKGLGVRETKKRQPAVGIPARLLAHMRRWARKGISKTAVVEFNGKPVASVKKAFAHAAADAGLEDVSPHVLRHTAASWAMQNGADLYEAADYLGMTAEMLERVYGHLRPEHHKGVGDAITGRTRRR